MAESNTSICNQALDKLGASRIVNFDDNKEASLQAVKCRLHFEPTRDALLRSHYWPFAAARESLSEDTVAPAFEYDNQFILPTDFMYLRTIFADNFTVDRNSRNRHAIEGDRLLTNNSTAQIRYTKKVTDPTKFDPLFIEVLVLKLALKLISLAGANRKMSETISVELRVIMRQVKALSRQEAELTRELDWNDVRHIRGGRSGAKRGSF